VSESLTEFLLARIAEDEAAPLEWQRVGGEAGSVAARRLLAECEAKRRIVGDLTRFIDTADAAGARADHPTLLAGLEYQLRYLAAIYADHADYREEWTP
jgi:hypothetical protein